MTKPTDDDDDCPFDLEEELEEPAAADPPKFPSLLMPLLSTPYHKHLDLAVNNEATMQVVADPSFASKRFDFIAGRIKACDTTLRRRNIRGTFGTPNVEDESCLLTFHSDDFSRDGNPYSCWVLFFSIRTGHYDIVVVDRVFDNGYATNDLLRACNQEPSGKSFVSGTLPVDGGGAAKFLSKRFEFIHQAGGGRGGRMQLIRPLSGSYRFAVSGVADHFTSSLHGLVSPYANLTANRVSPAAAVPGSAPFAASNLRPEEMRPDGTRFVGRM